MRTVLRPMLEDQLKRLGRVEAWTRCNMHWTSRRSFSDRHGSWGAWCHYSDTCTAAVSSFYETAQGSKTFSHLFPRTTLSSHSKRGLTNTSTNLSFSFVSDSFWERKVSLSPRKSPLERAKLPFPDRAGWSWNSHHKISKLVVYNLNSQSVNCSSAGKLPATCATTRVWRCIERGTCTGVVKEWVGNLAVAGANWKRAICVIFCSKRSHAPCLPSKMHYVYKKRKKKQRNYEMKPFGQNKRWAHGWPPCDEHSAAYM